MENNGKGFVKVLITIFAIIGGIWSVIQIIDYFTTKNAVIEVKGNYSDFSMPNTFAEDVKNQRKKVSFVDILDEIPEEVNDRIKISKEIADSLNKTRANDEKKEFYPFELKSFWEISVTNNGVKEEKDLKLEIPSEGFYELENAEIKESNAFSKVINLGSIRPSNNIKIKIWSDYTSLISDDVKVTYPSGVSKVIFPEIVFGYWASIIRYSPILLFILIVLLSFVLILLFSTSSSQTSIKNSKNDEVTEKKNGKPIKELKKDANVDNQKEI